jgi:hypothetical protein
MDMDWSKLDLVVFATGNQPVKGLVCLPEDNKLVPITLNKSGNKYQLEKDPLGGKVTWKIRMFSE